MGRDSELTAIQAVLTAAATTGQTLVMTGVAGIGKTALLNAADAMARRAGYRVLRCAGSEFEVGIGYAGLHQLLVPALGEVSEVPAAVASAVGLDSGPAPTALAVVNAVMSLLDDFSDQQRLAILVDDIQWLDQLSASALGMVARRIAGTRCALIATHRTGMASFFPRSGLREVVLGPLSDATAAAVMSRWFPDLPGHRRIGLVRQAEGNPLALRVLPQVGIDSSSGGSCWGTLPLSRRLTETFGAQVTRLPPATRSLLLELALDADPTSTWRMDLAVLEPAERAAIVNVDAHTRRITFGHPLIRMAVVELSTAHQRRVAHQRLAAAATDPVRRAFHLSDSTTERSEGIAAEIEAAAYSVLRRADAGAALRLLTRSAELTPGRKARTRRLAAAAGIGAEVTGELDNASKLIEAASAGEVDSPVSLAAAVASAQLLVNSDSDIDTATRLLTNAIETLTNESDFTNVDDDLVRALQVLTALAWYSADDQAWAPFRRFSARMGPGLPETLRISEGLLCDPARHGVTSLPALERLIADLELNPDPQLVVRTAKAALHVDRIADCEKALWRVIDDGRGGGAVALAMMALALLVAHDWFSGDWDRATELAAEVHSLCSSHGYRRYDWIVAGFAALVSAARGGPEQALVSAADKLEQARARGAGIAHQFLQHVKALGALSRGDFNAAFAAFTEVLHPHTVTAGAPHMLWFLLDFVEAAARSGHDRAARTYVQAVTATTLADVSPRYAMESLAASALVSGSDTQADELFERALGVDGADRFRFQYARVQLLYGEHLRRRRAAAQARRHLADARETFHQLAATPWIARATSELSAAGDRRWSRADAAKLDALTPQEREIVKLAAAGLSNKQIGERLSLSHRTVGVHLYRAFPKLGVTSRAALRDALAVPPIP
ncbi:hypothetical protein BCA37_11820 [Mycobacterium sp. djl-10]|nr:hypothetical protein BCA37_11820 [Mycobacterium sp. djl-10]